MFPLRADEDPFDGFDGERLDTLTPLMAAAATNDLQRLRNLLEKGLSPRAPNNQGVTALHVAARFGRTEMLSLMLEKCPDSINTVYTYNHSLTPLFFALEFRNYDTAKFLIDDHNADYNVDSPISHLVLHASANADVNIFSLTNFSGDWNVTNSQGQGPFFIFFKNYPKFSDESKERFLKLLADRRVNPCRVTEEGEETNVHVTMSYRDPKICVEACESLLDAVERWWMGPDFDEDEDKRWIETREGVMSAVVAVIDRMNKLEDGDPVEGFLKILKRLIDMGADVNASSLGVGATGRRHPDCLPVEQCLEVKAAELLAEHTDFDRIKDRMKLKSPDGWRMWLPNPPLTGSFTLGRTPFHYYTCFLPRCLPSLKCLLKRLNPDDFINRRWRKQFYSISDAQMMSNFRERPVPPEFSCGFVRGRPDLVDEIGRRVVSVTIEPWSWFYQDLGQVGILPFNGITPLAELLLQLRRIPGVFKCPQIAMEAVISMVDAGSSPSSIMMFDKRSKFEGYTLDPLVCLCAANLPCPRLSKEHRKVVDKVVKYLAGKGALISHESAAIVALCCENWLLDIFVSRGVLAPEGPDFGEVVKSRKLRNCLIHPRNLIKFYRFVWKLMTKFGLRMWDVDLASLISPTTPRTNLTAPLTSSEAEEGNGPAGGMLYPKFVEDVDKIADGVEAIDDQSRKIPDLAKMCRTVIRCNIYRQGENTTSRINKLDLPKPMKKYLIFKQN